MKTYDELVLHLWRVEGHDGIYGYAEAVRYMSNLCVLDDVVITAASKNESFIKFKKYTAVQFAKALNDEATEYKKAFAE